MMLALLQASLSLAIKAATLLLLKTTERITLSLQVSIGQKNGYFMPFKMLGGKKQCFLYQWVTLSLQLLSGVVLRSLLLHISCGISALKLGTESSHSLLDTVPTQPTIRPTASALFRPTIQRHTFHNRQLLLSAFIDVQNSFPSPGIHMLNCQITQMPFFKVSIWKVSLNWELTAN